MVRNKPLISALLLMSFFLTSRATVAHAEEKPPAQDAAPLSYSDGLSYIISSPEALQTIEDLYKTTRWPLILSKKADMGLNGELSDIYYYRSLSSEKKFGVQYVKYYGITKLKFFIRIMYIQSEGSRNTDCISIARFREYVIKSGWEDLEVYQRSTSHGFTAEKRGVRIDVQSDIGAGETTPGIPGTNYGVGSARSKPSNDQQAIDNMGCVNSFVAQQ